jgi:pimeloyl-ACP methyl ester carboxylesterase
LVPLFPRPHTEGGGNLYLHALSRESLLTRVPKYRRVDQQLLCMMQDVRERLQKRGLTIHSKALLYGFSASGSFVNRFAMLHPDRVLAVACGSPGGWPIAPVASINGTQLAYPVGIGDLESLSGHPVDWPALKSVAWFFFLGGKDINDSIGDRDSFSAEDEELVRRIFGPMPVSRWKEAEHLYTENALHARFHLYPEVAHVVTMAIKTDITNFFEKCLPEGALPNF